MTCPSCGNDYIVPVRFHNQHGNHMHTRYICTFWGTGRRERCGWEGWTVPDADEVIGS